VHIFEGIGWRLHRHPSRVRLSRLQVKRLGKHHPRRHQSDIDRHRLADRRGIKSKGKGDVDLPFLSPEEFQVHIGADIGRHQLTRKRRVHYLEKP
ncbi:uncharacterized protein METZ01_LOCUS116097, partial [marine metagenome]